MDYQGEVEPPVKGHTRPERVRLQINETRSAKYHSVYIDNCFKNKDDDKKRFWGNGLIGNLEAAPTDIAISLKGFGNQCRTRHSVITALQYTEIKPTWTDHNMMMADIQVGGVIDEIGGARAHKDLTTPGVLDHQLRLIVDGQFSVTNTAHAGYESVRRRHFPGYAMSGRWPTSRDHRWIEEIAKGRQPLSNGERVVVSPFEFDMTAAGEGLEYLDPSTAAYWSVYKNTLPSDMYLSRRLTMRFRRMESYDVDVAKSEVSFLKSLMACATVVRIMKPIIMAAGDENAIHVDSMKALINVVDTIPTAQDVNKMILSAKKRTVETSMATYTVEHGGAFGAPVTLSVSMH